MCMVLEIPNPEFQILFLFNNEIAGKNSKKQ